MKTLVDDIYEGIHEGIISGELKPGQRLHIVQLAEKYAVGPGPIREALSRLLATQLVIAISQRGFRVAPVSLHDLRDVFLTRMHIEAVALDLSIKKGSDRWEADLIGSHHLLAKFELEQKIKDKEDYQEWERRHRAFNLALISACGLDQLLGIQKYLYNLTERYRRQWLLVGIKQSEGLSYAKSQKKIMEAALAHDALLAIKLLHKHFENVIELLEAHYLKNRLFDE